MAITASKRAALLECMAVTGVQALQARLFAKPHSFYQYSGSPAAVEGLRFFSIFWQTFRLSGRLCGHYGLEERPFA